MLAYCKNAKEIQSQVSRSERMRCIEDIEIGCDFYSITTVMEKVSLPLSLSYRP